MRALREHVRSEITSWGHKPILSEYPTFLVSPDLSNVDNCKKVVRESADVFVIIIGGKRGSLDPATGRSIVNVEYSEARYIGIDRIVFVDRQVWGLLPHYNRNPEADFSSNVDYPDVFRFIEDIKNETKWIFQFSQTDEILTTLKYQLSVRFRELNLRARANKLTMPPEFANENPCIARLVVDKCLFWEFRLASELLKDRINRFESKFNDLTLGFVVRRTKFLSVRGMIPYIQDLLNDFKNIVQTGEKILHNQLTPACGSLGVSGDAVLIKRACDNLYSLFLSLYEWEQDVRFVRVHESCENLFLQMHNWTSEMMHEFRHLLNEIDELLSRPNIEGTYKITLVFNPPTGMSEFEKEFEKIQNDPQFIFAYANDN